MYSSCTNSKTGDTCIPTCATDYTATTADGDGFALSCDGSGDFSSSASTLVCGASCAVGAVYTLTPTGPCSTTTDGACTAAGGTTTSDHGSMNAGTEKTEACADWNGLYKGSFTLVCTAGTLSVKQGNTCALNNPCAAQGEDDCVSNPSATCTHTGPGAHSCSCPINTYGDGKTVSPFTGCTACPDNSESAAASTDFTSCICIVGYATAAGTRKLASADDKCTAVACPANSAAGSQGSVGNAQACTCTNPGFSGSIDFVSSTVTGEGTETGSNAYSDTCAAVTCDSSGITTPANADAANTGTASEAYGSTLDFTCSDGFTDKVTYTCGQDGKFATTDTCTAISCAENEYVSSNVCTGCASGTSNAAGDPASGGDTTCGQPCDLVEPTVGADMTAPAADSCDGTAGDAACAHACAPGYEGGSITCTSGSGSYAVVACTGWCWPGRPGRPGRGSKTGRERAATAGVTRAHAGRGQAVEQRERRERPPLLFKPWSVKPFSRPPSLCYHVTSQ